MYNLKKYFKNDVIYITSYSNHNSVMQRTKLVCRFKKCHICGSDMMIVNGYVAFCVDND